MRRIQILNKFADSNFFSCFRGKPFMHVRMQSQENVEISNPMYLREDADEDVESLDPTFVIASNKVIL